MNQPRRKILVVDDEEVIRSVMARTLRKEGYEVRLAANPHEGLAILAHEPIDLVIADHLMPEMTGLDFLKIVRDRFPNCVRLMLTGHADVDVVVQAINEGEIYRLVTKPWDDAELKATLFIAFEKLDLERENRQLLSMVRCQRNLIVALKRASPDLRVEPGPGAEAEAALAPEPD